MKNEEASNVLLPVLYDFSSHARSQQAFASFTLLLQFFARDAPIQR